MVQRIVPCIWLDGTAEAAAETYTRLLPGGRTLAVSHYPASTDNPAGRPRGSVLTVEVELAGLRFTLLDGGPLFHPNPSVSFFVQVEAPGEATALFERFAEGGRVLIPLDAYPWSARYGWVQDRFGVSWQVMAGRRPGAAVIVPCLMFAGAQRGRASEAMKSYTATFPGSRIGEVARYERGEGPVGAVKHGRMTLLGQELVVMDSHAEHGVTFDEGVSLQLLCVDQAELDRSWTALSAGGVEGPCGWVKDRFGLSWQVVPADILRWMTAPDAAARDRVFDAVMGMKKLDLAALEQAFAGRTHAPPAAAPR